MIGRIAVFGVLTLMLAFVPRPVSAEPALTMAPEKSRRPIARHSALDTARLKVALLRPKARPEAPPVVERLALFALPGQRPGVRPAERPVSEQTRELAVRAQTVAFLGPDVSARPFPRPESVVQEALFGRRKKRKGSVCGDFDIQGKKIGKVPGKLNGCGDRKSVV